MCALIKRVYSTQDSNPDLHSAWARNYPTIPPAVTLSTPPAVAQFSRNEQRRSFKIAEVSNLSSGGYTKHDWETGKFKVLFQVMIQMPRPNLLAIQCLLANLSTKETYPPAYQHVTILKYSDFAVIHRYQRFRIQRQLKKIAIAPKPRWEKPWNNQFSS